MFSGLIQQKGIVAASSPSSLRVAISRLKLPLGASVAINGVCLTVAKKTKQGGTTHYIFDISPETRLKTTLSLLMPSETVNVEPSLTLNDPLGGHLVQGHVDDRGLVQKVVPNRGGRTIWFKAPSSIMKYVVAKGSIAIDGVSLTVVDVAGNSFSVAVIPYTLSHTTLGQYKVGRQVNLEADIIAKYVAKYTRARTTR